MNRPAPRGFAPPSARVAATLNAALAHEKAGRLDRAIAAYREAIGAAPGFAPAIAALGVAQRRAGDLDGAIESLRRATRLQPGYAPAQLGLAHALRAAGRLDEAIVAYEAARRLKPTDDEIGFALASALKQVGRLADAVEAAQAILAREPAHLGARSIALNLAMAGCDFAASERHVAARDTHLAASLARPNGFAALSATAYLALFRPMPATGRASLLAAIDAALPRERVAMPARARDPDRRLRVGYLSPNFGGHPVGQVSCSLYGAHDRASVEIFAYATGARARESSDHHARIRAGVDHFVELPARAARQAAERIAADSIDILVDLDGYMDATSPPILAHRPAPVQAFWLGHASGLGLACVDYLIADRVVVPPGEEALHREAIARLPEVYHPADRARIGDATPSRAAEGLPDDAVVFCVFNNPEKIDRAILATWFAILREVPRGVLWLSGPSRHADPVAKLREEARAARIDPDRLVFGRYCVDKADHLARHRLADLFLDTITLNAATTALDALWAGLPVLTRKGDRFANRMAESFLAALGLDGLIAPDLDAYVSRAIALARDATAREAMRQDLAKAISAAPLFKPERLARHLESVYRAMWRRHVAGEKPVGFDVPVVA